MDNKGSENKIDINKIVSLIETFPTETKKEKTEEELYVGEKRNQELARFIDESGLRHSYTNRIFVFTCIWLILVFACVSLCSLKIIYLSDIVIITLITTTTANVFGFFLLIVKYLFNPSKST